tara:strand:+ start:324 stop:1658 length:1335 start_codon:yes stop_codon:yes gene_type:complete
MNIRFIWILAFLIGLFIILSVIILNNFFINYNNVENFVYDNITNSPDDNTDDNTHDNIDNNNNNENDKNNENDNNNNNENDNIIINNNKNEIVDKKNINNKLKSNEKDLNNKKNLCYSKFRSSNIKQNIDNFDEIPFKEDIIMSINTYNNFFPKIYNSKLKWYDEYNYNNDSNEDENNNLWFNINNTIKLIKYDNKISSANLNNVELRGPDSTKFTDDNDYKLKPFTSLFIMKINELKEKNRLLQIGLQSIDTISNKNVGNFISLNINKIINNKDTEDCKTNLEFILDFAGQKNKFNHVYTINNILNRDLFIAIIFDGKYIKLIIDDIDEEYLFKNTNLIDELKLGSNPLIINKNGSLNMELYSFTFYKKILNNIDLDLYIKYNSNNIYRIKELNNKNKKLQEEIEKSNIENASKLKTLYNELSNKDKELERVKREYNNLLKIK